MVLIFALAGCSDRTSITAPGRSLARVPLRVVSINPCVDAILMHVADPGQIAGISHYSQDPRATSIALDVAMRFHATSGTAEEVMVLAPDLVIAGGHVAPSTIDALRRLHIPLIQLGVPETIAESSAQIRQIAAAVGHSGRGEHLVNRINTAVERAASTTAPIPALIWQGGGLVPGKGTLADELLRVSGFRGLSADYGLKRWDVLPLEYLVAKSPRVLFAAGQADVGDRMLTHPVLRSLGNAVTVRGYASRLLNCGGPTIIAAVERLHAARLELAARP